MEILWRDFEKVDLRVGTVIQVDDFPEARNPSYKLLIDFGNDIGKKRSSAQITKLYTKSDLLGKQIIAVINFPAKQIGPFLSECLVLGAVEGKTVTLLTPETEVSNGSRIS